MNKIRLIITIVFLLLNTINGSIYGMEEQPTTTLTYENPSMEDILLQALKSQNSIHETAIDAIVISMSEVNPLKRDLGQILFNSELQPIETMHKTKKPRLRGNFPCPECGRVLTRQNDLTVHRRIHTGERPFSCTEAGCNKAFPTQNKLKIHTRTHTGEENYPCTVNGCSKAFITKDKLTVHKKVHTKETPYKCPSDGCNKKFGYQSNLNAHLKRMHPTNNIHQ